MIDSEGREGQCDMSMSHWLERRAYSPTPVQSRPKLQADEALPLKNIYKGRPPTGSQSSVVYTDARFNFSPMIQ
jgi:hypothetical protein